jgi:signal peptidase II
MLCFVFAALIVALDQFFKQWILRTLDIGAEGPIVIPGILRLTRWENDGAMLNILSGQQWLLAAIAFGAAVVLVMILLRYNEGFWGTLGLAAVLGGTVGNLADRLFNDGKVVDMFETLFIRFPIFNIADIFITLGFLTFLAHFIIITLKTERAEKAEKAANTEHNGDDYEEHSQQDYINGESGELADIEAYDATQAEHELAFAERTSASGVQYPESAVQTSNESQIDSAQEYSSYQQVDAPVSDYQEPLTDSLPSLDEIGMDFDSLGDYNVDDILREYGIEDD